MASENGWEPSRLDPNSDLLTWKTVPGSEPPVSLQVMKGLPEVFLPAWAADWNAYIEPLRDSICASYTPTNSVATSNHLNGTAEDLNWDFHPFQQTGSLNAAQMQTVSDMEDFYEGWMFWAGRWTDPVDEMHSQMGYNTWNRNTAALDFISRKIRSDGFSTFRRGVLTPSDPPHADAQPTAPPPNPASSDTPTQVLYDAVPVIDINRAAELVDRVVAGLALAQCDNVNRIAMWLAQIGEESGGFVYTEEIAKNGRYAPYIGRTWIQITWDYNYRAFGYWAHDQGLIEDPEFFVNNPESLADEQWAAVGPAWYWTVARPQINDLSDQGDIVGVTKAINGGLNGLQDRTDRYHQAIALGDRLLLLAGGSAPAPPTPPTPSTPGESMANVPQEQWDRVYRELTQLLSSRSPLRHLGEGPIDTLAGITLNIDGMSHIDYVRTLAGYGHPPTIALLQEVAGAAGDSRYPNRQDDALLAQAILAEANSAPATQAPTPTPAPVTYLPDSVKVGKMSVDIPQAPATASSPGQVIGQAFDALHALLSEADSLSDSEKVTYNALISALNTKIGVSGK